MNVTTINRCRSCKSEYTLCAPTHYKDSGFCQDCDDEVLWLEKHLGADATCIVVDPCASKTQVFDEWSMGAFLGLVGVVVTIAFVTSGVYALIYRWTR